MAQFVEPGLQLPASTPWQVATEHTMVRRISRSGGGGGGGGGPQHSGSGCRMQAAGLRCQGLELIRET